MIWRSTALRPMKAPRMFTANTLSNSSSGISATGWCAPMIPALFQVGFAFVMAAIPAALLERPWEGGFAPEALLSVVWLGLFGSGMAYLDFFRLLRSWGATRTSLVAYLLPIWGIALGALVLAEPIDARLLLGTALVIAGIGLVNIRRGSLRLWGRRTTPVLTTAG